MTRRIPAPDLQLLTIPEVAERLRVHRDTVYELLRRGELAYVFVGSKRRVRATDLEEYIERRL